MSNHVLRGKGKPFPYRESVCNFAQGRSVSWMLLRGVPGRHALQRSVCGFAGRWRKTGCCCGGRRDAAPYREPFAVKPSATRTMPGRIRKP